MTESNFSRRTFLKSSAAVAAAATFASLGTNFAHAGGSDRIKVGLVGCGGRGTGAAFDCCKASPRVCITALGDLFKDRPSEEKGGGLDLCRAQLKGDGNKNKGLGEQYAVTDDNCFIGFDAYKHVIDSGIDLVLLCTPPGFRPLHFRYAVEKNKHVFFEKPVAVDPVGVRSVIATADLAKQKNLGVLSGTVFRHHTPHREAIAQIHDGVIGDIVSGSSYYNQGGLWHIPRKPDWSDTEWQIRNWLYFTWLSGDHIVEQAIHRIDIQNWIMKSHPLSAYGMGGRQARTDPKFGHIYDHFCIEYLYPNDVRIAHSCRQQDGTDARITEYYVGTKGAIEPSEGPILKTTGKKPKLEQLGVAYVREHKDLIDSIVGGTPLNEGRQVAESSLTAIMGRMSAYTGKLVTWDAAMNSKLDLWPKEPLAFGPMQVPPVAMPGKEPLV